VIGGKGFCWLGLVFCTIEVGLIGYDPGACRMAMICDYIYKLNPNLRPCNHFSCVKCLEL
jgi:hypothetical protein